MKKNEIKNILVYRIGHLGDTLVSIPAFHSIRESYPNAKITLLTNVDAENPNFVMAKGILPEEGMFDKVLTYVSNRGKYGSLWEYAKLLPTLKNRKFDVVVYLTTRNRTVSQINRDTKFFRLAGIKNIIGAKTLLLNRLVMTEIRPLSKVGSELEFLLECILEEGFTDKKNINVSLNLTDNERNFSTGWLENNCGNALNENRLFGVALSSKWESKNWEVDNFLQVITQMIEKRNAFPVFFGGSGEIEIGDKLIKVLSVGANAAGQLNIRKAAAALENCRIFLGNDTGTTHLAASVKTPCIAIFAAVDWAGRWYPFGDSNTVFRETVECEGCHSPVCFNNNKCLRLIEPEKVIQACLKTWDKVD